MNQELSHFEKLSAQIPRKQPVAILIAMALLPLLLWGLNVLAPNEGVKNLKEQKDEASAVAAPSAAEDLEEL